MVAWRAWRLLPAVWAGLLLCIALIATPAPFAALAPADAGRVVARIFVQEAWASLVIALLLLSVERRRAREAAEAGRGSVMSPEVLMLLGTVFCTVAGHFALQPLLPSARSGSGPLSFGQIHAASVAFFGIKTVLVGILAWRTAARQDGA